MLHRHRRYHHRSYYSSSEWTVTYMYLTKIHSFTIAEISQFLRQFKRHFEAKVKTGSKGTIKIRHFVSVNMKASIEPKYCMTYERDQSSQFGVRTTNSSRFLSFLLSSRWLWQQEYLLSLYNAKKLTGYPLSPRFSLFLRRRWRYTLFSIQKYFLFTQVNFFPQKDFHKHIFFLNIFLL